MEGQAKTKFGDHRAGKLDGFNCHHPLSVLELGHPEEPTLSPKSSHQSSENKWLFVDLNAFLKVYFYCILFYVHECFTYKFIYIPHVCNSYEGQKEAADPLELEL